MKNNLLEKFISDFGKPEVYVKSPGRANIIGEHTDYNQGLVLPFAIEQCIHFYIGSNQKGKLRLFAYNLTETKTFDMSQMSFQKEGWERYFINTFAAINHKVTKGIDVVFGGNLPNGGGVSSSSAIACGFLSGINVLLNLKFSKEEIISLASEIENGIGLNGGIMDQTAIIKGKTNHALKIDFLDMSIEEIPMPSDHYSFYLFNSGQSHNLVDTAYNIRRNTCENALKAIQKSNDKVQSLRDVSIKELDSFSLDQRAYNRCAHVINENTRVGKAVQLLKSKDYDDLGQILIESHLSLSQLYEVSTPEIDYLVGRSQKIKNLLGCRIMGGGFGGCTINFIINQLETEEIKALETDYKKETGLELTILEIKAGNGIEVTQLNE